MAELDKKIRKMEKREERRQNIGILSRRVAVTAVFCLTVFGIILAFSKTARADFKEWIRSVFEVSEEGKENLRYYRTYEGNYGPMDFAVAGESEFFILDNVACRVQHYVDESYKDTIILEKGSDALAVRYFAGKLYVLDRYCVSVYLPNGSREAIIYLPKDGWPEASVVPFGLLVNDIIWEDGTLVLITEVLGNFALNEVTKIFEKTEAGYACFRNGVNVCVTIGDEEIEIAAEELDLQFLGRDTAGLFYFVCFDYREGPDSEAYGSIRAYDRSGKMIWLSYLDTADWNHYPTFSAHLYNGYIYTMSAYKETVVITKINGG